jgi:hypothetical protein
MLSVIMQNVVMQNVVMLNVIMQNVVMLIVVAPGAHQKLMYNSMKTNLKNLRDGLAYFVTRQECFKPLTPGCGSSRRPPCR